MIDVDKEDMRSFALLLFVGLITWQVSLPAQAVEQERLLFEIEIPKEGKSFDALLKRAIQIQLIRLTGSMDVLSSPKSQVFTKNPKNWLNTYGYRPVIVDGVTVGEKIFFEFSAQSIHAQFQKSDLLVWPLHKRPKLFVVASHSLAGSVTKLTEQNLQYRTDMYFTNFARNVALEIDVPKNNTDWLLPENRLQNRILEEMLEKSASQYLLAIDIRQSADGKTELIWQLFASNLVKVAERTIKNRQTSRDYLKQAFYDVLGVVSSSYRKGSGILGEISLSVSGIDTFADFNALESFLMAQRAQFNNVTLVESSQNKVVFEIQYRGSLESVMDSLNKNINLVITGNNALIGKVLAEWQ